TQFVVSLIAKPVTGPGERSRKGEEINCNLSADPGDGFEPGTYVELVNPQVHVYAIPDKEDARKIANAGMWFKAEGLKPAGSGGLSSAALVRLVGLSPVSGGPFESGGGAFLRLIIPEW